MPKLLDLNIPLFKKSTTNREEVSSIEAYNLWNTLRARYLSVETYEFFRNFVHDRDFDLILQDHLDKFNSQIEVLENKARDHKITMPSRPPENINFSAKIDVATDKFLFRKTYSDLITELFFLNRSITTSTLNDGLREIFIDFTDEHIRLFKGLFEYGKLKGWTQIAPAYITYKPVEKEELSTSEANHLWDHINLRYDHIRLTEIFMDFIHDEDFRMVLQQGNKVLEDQINTLIAKATEHEIPLPPRPAAFHKISVDPEIIEDEFTYRVILGSIQEAIDLHLRAVIETFRNDMIRDIFYKLYNGEVNIFNNLIKYGKIKGWTHILPMYHKI